MKKQHYEAIVAARVRVLVSAKASPDVTVREFMRIHTALHKFAEELVPFLVADNAHFDAEKFRKAMGVPDAPK